GELSTDGDASIVSADGREISQCALDALGRLEENRRHARARHAEQLLAPRAAFARQEAEKAEWPRDQSRQRDVRSYGAGPMDYRHDDAARSRSPYQLRARIADRGHAGVADER